MNQKCQKKKMEEEAQSSTPAAAAPATEPAAPATEPTAESTESITMPLVEEEPKKLVASRWFLTRSCP